MSMCVCLLFFLFLCLCCAFNSLCVFVSICIYICVCQSCVCVSTFSSCCSVLFFHLFTFRCRTNGMDGQVWYCWWACSIYNWHRVPGCLLSNPVKCLLMAVAYIISNASSCVQYLLSWLSHCFSYGFTLHIMEEPRS